MQSALTGPPAPAGTPGKPVTLASPAHAQRIPDEITDQAQNIEVIFFILEKIF